MGKIVGKILGRYLVADPEVCGGTPTIRGTSIPIASVLEQVATGRAFELISRDTEGTVSVAAIAEAAQLAHEAFEKHGRETLARSQGDWDPAREREARDLQAVGTTYLVADPQIHHGTPTFRGTRIPISSVLEDVVRDRDWEMIRQDWTGVISRAAIREAVLIAREAFLAHYQDFVIPPLLR
jgi:uncharacterized protein (DUF433 family)